MFGQRLYKGICFLLASMLLDNAAGSESSLAAPASKFGKDPVAQSDIVGRDLNIPGVSVLGHVGLWTGQNVIEALNQSPAIVQNTLADFKSRSAYWGASYYPTWNTLPTVYLPSQVRFPYNFIAYTAQAGAVRRAVLIQQIGAKYTVSPYMKEAFVEECHGLKCTGPTLGEYRCDTFLKDALISAGVSGFGFGALDAPAGLWSSFPERR